MLSVQAATIPTFGGDVDIPPSPAQAPGSTTVPPSPRPGESIDKWFEGLQKYEPTLQAMAQASEEPKFREELGTIEQWFAFLSDSEQTASLYTLVQHAKSHQLKFLSDVLAQMTENTPAEKSPKPKAQRTLRPPNLNLPTSPLSPRFVNGQQLPSAPPSARLPIPPRSSGGLEPPPSAGPVQELLLKRNDENSWANLVPTPMDKMFASSGPSKSSPALRTPLSSGLMNPQAAAAMNAALALSNGGMSPLMNINALHNMNMMGMQQQMANEAQLLAMQMVMSGLVSPIPQQQQHYQQQPQQQRVPSGGKVSVPVKNNQQPLTRGKSGTNANGNWRSTSNSKFSAGGNTGIFNGARSATKSGPGFKGPKSAATPSTAAPTTAGVTPKEEDFDPAILDDVPAWLKSLRLHKYTDSFVGMTWRDMIKLTEDDLEARGVAALGARRRMTKTFEIVKRKMGIESSDSAKPTVQSAGVKPMQGLPELPKNELVAPHSAAPVFAH